MFVVPDEIMALLPVNFIINNTNQVQLDLLDSKGNVVSNVLNEQREAGKQEVQTSVAELSPGLYFYQLKTGFVKETKKLMVIR